jgi:hypothetical protein
MWTSQLSWHGCAGNLTEEVHENKIYSLAGDPAVSFTDIGKVLSDIRGTEMPCITVSDRQYIENWMAEGFPEPVAAFALAAMASTVASGKNRPATWRGSCAATDDNRGLPSGQLSRRNSRNRSAEGQRGRVKGRGAASRRHFFSARSMRAVSDVS